MNEYDGKFKFCKLNWDENPKTAVRHWVMSNPLLLFFKDGQKVDESLDAVPESVTGLKVEALR